MLNFAFLIILAPNYAHQGDGAIFEVDVFVGLHHAKFLIVSVVDSYGDARHLSALGGQEAFQEAIIDHSEHLVASATVK